MLLPMLITITRSSTALLLAASHIWASGRPGTARHDHGPAQHDGYQAKEARRALRAVPHRPAGLAFGPGTGLWAIFRAVLAREARQK